MKKLLFTNTILALAVFALTGCPASTTNTTTTTNTRTNTTNSNTGVVVNSNTNMPASNMDSNMNSNMNTSTSSGSPTDVNGFMTEAAKGGMAEVELGKVAVSKAQNAEVKQFAQQMVADHTKANNELKQVAEKKSVVLPADLDAMHKSMKDKLTNLSGAEFDKEYMRGQVEDHEKMVALFESQASGGTDAEAKALATKTLPNLKMHLDMARKIQAKLK